MDPVNDKDLENLTDWLWYRDDGGLGFLYDEETKGILPDTSTKDLYEDPEDLISLAPRPGEKDDFTELFMGSMLKYLHDKFLYKLRVRPMHYFTSSLLVFVIELKAFLRVIQHTVTARS